MPTYNELEKLHKSLKKENVFLIKDAVVGIEEYICLKRDVECKVKKAYKLCVAEHKLGLKEQI